MSASFWLRTGAIWGFLAVAMGSFGAHGLRERFDSLGNAPRRPHDGPAQREFPHRDAISDLLRLRPPGRRPDGPGRPEQRRGARRGRLAVPGGLAVFSGSLYVLCVTGDRWLGRITPIGGVAMLAGWIALAVAAGASSKFIGETGTP